MYVSVHSYQNQAKATGWAEWNIWSGTCCYINLHTRKDLAPYYYRPSYMVQKLLYLPFLIVMFWRIRQYWVNTYKLQIT